MFYVYILKSLSSDHYYTGFANDLTKRIEYHNQGRVTWTKRYLPWKIIYNEEYSDKASAIKREKYLKSHSGRNWIKKNINNFMGL